MITGAKYRFLFLPLFGALSLSSWKVSSEIDPNGGGGGVVIVKRKLQKGSKNNPTPEPIVVPFVDPPQPPFPTVISTPVPTAKPIPPPLPTWIPDAPFSLPPGTTLPPGITFPPTKPLVTGCIIALLELIIENKLATTLYADSASVQEGYIEVGNCGTVRKDQSINFANQADDCFTVSPGTKNGLLPYNTGCAGAIGSLTMKPAEEYQMVTGLSKVIFKWENRGGPSAKQEYSVEFAYVALGQPYPGWAFGYEEPTEIFGANAGGVKVTYTIEETETPSPTSAPVTFGDYDGLWVLIGGGGTAVYNAGYSWSETNADTYNEGFERGISYGANIGFGGKNDPVQFGMNFAASQKSSTSVSSTLSRTSTETKSFTCASRSCPSGLLYQWRVGASLVGDPTNAMNYVDNCAFQCVSYNVPEGPKCPFGYCFNDDCQCCNGVWLEDWEANENLLPPMLGGTCKPGCTYSGKGCSSNDDCCSDKCNIRSDVVGGTCS